MSEEIPITISSSAALWSATYVLEVGDVLPKKSSDEPWQYEARLVSRIVQVVHPQGDLG